MDTDPRAECACAHRVVPSWRAGNADDVQAPQSWRTADGQCRDVRLRLGEAGPARTIAANSSAETNHTRLFIARLPAYWNARIAPNFTAPGSRRTCCRTGLQTAPR